MSKHTPGPWHVDNNDQVRSATGVVIARCERRERHEYMDGREQSANARLIAAAPELLEALRALVRDIQYCVDDGTFKQQDVDTTPSMIAARAAIAKAEAP